MSLLLLGLGGGRGRFFALAPDFARLGSEKYVHASSTFFNCGRLFDGRRVGQSCHHAIEEDSTYLRIAPLTSPKTHPETHLGTIPEKLADALGLKVHVVGANLGVHPDLFDIDGALALARQSFLLGLFVKELAVVHETAHRRFCSRRNLHKIDIALYGKAHRLARRADPQLLARVVDQPHFADRDGLIDPVLSIAYLVFTSCYVLLASDASLDAHAVTFA